MVRKEYRRAVAELFLERLAECAPDFERVLLASPLLFGGESIFRWDISEDFHAFVLLVPSPQGHQAFTVELAWSCFARFPEAGMRPSVMLGPDDPQPTALDEGIVRLGGLASRTDVWWSLPDPAMERPGSVEALQESMEPIPSRAARTHASEAVDAAVTMLVDVGIPFLVAAEAASHD